MYFTFGSTGLTFDHFENRILLKSVLVGMTDIAFFITGHKHTHFMRVFYLYFFGLVLASKGTYLFLLTCCQHQNESYYGYSKYRDTFINCGIFYTFDYHYLAIADRISKVAQVISPNIQDPYCNHLLNESRHDKNFKVACAPSEDSNQRMPRLIRIFAGRMELTQMLSCSLRAQQ